MCLGWARPTIEGRRRWQRIRWLDGITNSMDNEFEQTPGDCEGQGSLVCRSLWGRKESDMTLQLNNRPKIWEPPERNFASKDLYNQSYGFSRSHVWIWELGHNEGWVPKNWCFQIVVLEKILESPLYCKEIKPTNPKGNHPWIYIGRTDAKAPIFWPAHVKRRIIRKDPDARKCWGQEEKWVTEDEMFR